MVDKSIKWSVVQSCAEKIAGKLGKDAHTVAQEMKNSLEASGTRIDYGDDLDFTFLIEPKKINPP